MNGRECMVTIKGAEVANEATVMKAMATRVTVVNRAVTATRVMVTNKAAVTATRVMVTNKAVATATKVMVTRVMATNKVAAIAIKVMVTNKVEATATRVMAINKVEATATRVMATGAMVKNKEVLGIRETADMATRVDITMATRIMTIVT
jgi:hypothetical protein